MAKFKRNVVRPNIFDYNLAIFGTQGVGKTTLAYNVCHKLLGDDYVIFNCGKEDGIKALPDAIYYDCPTWDEFDEIIDDIVNNRTSDDYKDLKVVVLDTIDEIFNMAQERVIKLSNRKNPAKPATTINEAFSGFGAGLQKTEELVLDALWRLKSVGVNVFVIGHTKNKTMTDVVNDAEYDILTSNLSNRYFTAIATKMDVIGICYVDRDIITEKTNRKDIKGKTIEKNVIANEARKICFRSDNYATASKSRFPDIEGIIDLDADKFVEAIETAIQKLIDKSTMSKEDIEKYHAEEEAKRTEEIAKREEEMRVQREAEQEKAELEEVVGEIINFVKANISNNKEAVESVMAACKERGYANPTEITSLEDAKTILAITLK